MGPGVFKSDIFNRAGLKDKTQAVNVTGMFLYIFSIVHRSNTFQVGPRGPLPVSTDRNWAGSSSGL